MTTSKEYHEYVMDLFRPILPVTDKRMFGGVGIFSDGLCFAIISSDDVAYLKVDDDTRPDFEALGMPKFHNLGYYQIPPDILEDTQQLREWASRSIEIAKRKSRKKRKK